MKLQCILTFFDIFEIKKMKFSSPYNKTNLFYSIILACGSVTGMILCLCLWPQLKSRIELLELFLTSENIASIGEGWHFIAGAGGKWIVCALILFLFIYTSNQLGKQKVA